AVLIGLRQRNNSPEASSKYRSSKLWAGIALTIVHLIGSRIFAGFRMLEHEGLNLGTPNNSSERRRVNEVFSTRITFGDETYHVANAGAKHGQPA
ncbi:MAG: hypothetical protein ABI923_11710, partial [bacterium]